MKIKANRLLVRSLKKTLKVGVVGSTLGVLVACGAADDDEQRAVKGPPSADFSPSVTEGRVLYGRHCAECHGMTLKGTHQGPPLLHKYYEPGHHGDRSFYQAVKAGVKQHHWEFGDMKPMPEVAPTAVAHIVAFVRERQQQAGIH